MNPTVKLLEVNRIPDARGWFAESYSMPRLAEFGIQTAFRQDNLSCSHQAGTIRGFHFQAPPRAQAKLVSCVRGSIVDYALDLRQGSPTYGAIAYARLSADNGRQLFIPPGFGHAFIVMEPETLVAYKSSDTYAPETEMGVVWNDPALAIDWPLADRTPVLSTRDAALPRLAELESPFVYDGIPMTAVGCLD